ncbi:MAG TPA: carboxypeptidase regulatory-like domain-containing protein [Solirubrobacteraceae bacterium]|nr:carboxypeptidase regulatory-like domain-containing protein [Solirubrobacteraceae bacterium]
MRVGRGALWGIVALIACAASLALAPVAGAFGGTSSISGKVTEASGAKNPVENIEVTVLEAGSEFAFAGLATTNAAGEYTVSGLAPGSYKVRFAPPTESTLNFAPQYWEDKATFAEATDVPIAVEGEAKTGIDAALREGGTIKGTVTNPDAQPVADALVFVYSGPGEFEGFAGDAKTNAKGEYSVVGLASASYRVEVIPPTGVNLVPQFYANEPSFADATQVAVKVEEIKQANVTLQVGGEISGRVTDSATHNPIGGVFVEATNAAGFSPFGGFAVTNSSGEYTIEGLATGSYNVEFVGPESTPYLVQTDNGVSVTQGSTTSGVNAALVPEAPNNTSSPTASGTAAVGQTLSCSNGSWSGISPISYAYKWLRDGSTIEGATGSSYVVQSADQGHGVACEVTATNSKGHSSAKSNTLSVPLPPPPPPPVPSVALASAKVIVTGDVARVPIHCNTATCTGTIELVLQIVTKHHRGHRTITRKLTIVLGQASYTLAAGQTRLLVVHLSKSGKHRLDATRHHELSIALLVSVQGGSKIRQQVLLMQAPVKRK